MRRVAPARGDMRTGRDAPNGRPRAIPDGRPDKDPMKRTSQTIPMLTLAALAACLPAGGCRPVGEHCLQQARAEEDDDSRAARLMLQAARFGSPEAMVEAGRMHLAGKWVEADPDAAFAWFRKAARAGHPDGMFFLGDCFQKGTGTQEDPEKAAEWKEKAFAADSPPAMLERARDLAGHPGGRDGAEEAIGIFNRLLEEEKFDGAVDRGAILFELGRLHEEGNGIPRDAAKAVACYERAVASGNMPAAHRLGIACLEGTLCAKDLGRGVSLLKKTLSSRNLPELDTLQRLGNAYLDDKWEGMDLRQAETFFERALNRWKNAPDASDASIRDALCGLGKILLSGKGRTRDEAMGVTYLERAERVGSAEARYRLALALCRGSGRAQDTAKALELLAHIDAETDGEWAGKAAELAETIRSAEPYREAAEAGDPVAQRRFGLCLADGLGVPRNDTEAQRWLREAARTGDGEARAALERWGGRRWNSEDDEWLSLHETAKTGDAAAQRNLGKRYLMERHPHAENWQDVANAREVAALEGYGARQAVRWLESAAKAGDADALYWLAFCAAHGIGMPKNGAQAGKMLASAEKRGLAKAGRERARMLGNERILREKSARGDRAAQFELGTMLAERGDPEGIKMLQRLANAPKGMKAVLWLEGHYRRRNRDQAMHWCQRAVDLGNRDAMARMADYEPGNAFFWWKKVYDNGGGDAAAVAIGRCCEEGKGCPRDLREARQWYLRGHAPEEAARLEESGKKSRGRAR